MFAAECCSEFIAYSTAPGPTGPWTYRGTVMPRQGGSITNHAGVVDFNGGSYFFYHNGGLAGGGGYTRSVTVEKFTYNADGTIPTINMTTAGVPQVGTLNPYTRQEAETIAWGVPGTGGWQTWTTVSWLVSGATGTHDLYLRNRQLSTISPVPASKGYRASADRRSR